MAETKQGKELNLLHKRLFSNVPGEVEATVARLKKIGNKDSIPHLIQKMTEEESGEVYDSILSMMYQLKVSAGDELLLNGVQQVKSIQVKKDLLASFWNSGFDAQPHVSFFVETALENNDFLISFECLTLLETIVDKIDDNTVTESINQIQKTVKNQKDRVDSELLNSITTFLSENLIG